MESADQRKRQGNRSDLCVCARSQPVHWQTGHVSFLSIRLFVREGVCVYVCVFVSSAESLQGLAYSEMIGKQ